MELDVDDGSVVTGRFWLVDFFLRKFCKKC